MFSGSVSDRYNLDSVAGALGAEWLPTAEALGSLPVHVTASIIASVLNLYFNTGHQQCICVVGEWRMTFVFQTKGFIFPSHLLISFPFLLTQPQFPSHDKCIFSCNYFTFLSLSYLLPLWWDFLPLFLRSHVVWGQWRGRTWILDGLRRGLDGFV